MGRLKRRLAGRIVDKLLLRGFQLAAGAIAAAMFVRWQSVTERWPISTSATGRWRELDTIQPIVVVADITLRQPGR